MVKLWYGNIIIPGAKFPNPQRRGIEMFPADLHGGFTRRILPIVVTDKHWTLLIFINIIEQSHSFADEALHENKEMYRIL